jgi:hypothetical protein
VAPQTGPLAPLEWTLCQICRSDILFGVKWPKFWKASLISLAAYAAAILIGLWAGLWMLLFVPALQLVWTAVCIIRIVQLRRCGGHKADGLESELIVARRGESQPKHSSTDAGWRRRFAHLFG